MTYEWSRVSEWGRNMSMFCSLTSLRPRSTTHREERSIHSFFLLLFLELSFCVCSTQLSFLSCKFNFSLVLIVSSISGLPYLFIFRNVSVRVFILAAMLQFILRCPSQCLFVFCFPLINSSRRQLWIVNWQYGVALGLWQLVRFSKCGDNRFLMPLQVAKKTQSIRITFYLHTGRQQTIGLIVPSFTSAMQSKRRNNSLLGTIVMFCVWADYITRMCSGVKCLTHDVWSLSNMCLSPKLMHLRDKKCTC